MKRLFIPLFTVVMMLGFCRLVSAQTGSPELKHFAMKGLSFDYPVANQLEDHSSSTGQHLVIQSTGNAQIMIVSHYVEINSVAELATARHEVVDSFIETMWKEIHDQDPNVSRAPAQIEVAGAQATGVKLRAVLNNEPGNIEVYSLQLGRRLVLLSLIGSDREIAATSSAWLAIRRSLKIDASTEATTFASEFLRTGFSASRSRVAPLMCDPQIVMAAERPSVYNSSGRESSLAPEERNVLLNSQILRPSGA